MWPGTHERADVVRVGREHSLVLAARLGLASRVHEKDRGGETCCPVERRGPNGVEDRRDELPLLDRQRLDRRLGAALAAE